MNMTKAVLAVLLTLAFSLTHAAEEVTYYHSNLVGSPIAATDDTGALLWEQSYDPWGAPLLPPSDSRSFTGAPADTATELVDMQARWYSPHVGRMLALDPAGFREDSVHSFNLYAYGNNNPYRYVDPTGNVPVETIWDAANVAMGLASLGNNWQQGNYGSAAIDLLGVIVDGAATVVPYAPGGVGTAIKATRGLDAAGDVINTTVQQGRKLGDSFPRQRGAIGESPPKLQRIHSDDTILSGSSKFSFDYWTSQSTDDIVRSLRPGSQDALKIKPDGRIFDGNTRIKVLQDRGFDVNSLPREVLK